ncbi:MAG: hypothetical protein AAGE52_19170 [Myxococcota bacterium]
MRRTWVWGALQVMTSLRVVWVASCLLVCCGGSNDPSDGSVDGAVDAGERDGATTDGATTDGATTDGATTDGAVDGGIDASIDADVDAGVAMDADVDAMDADVDAATDAGVDGSSGCRAPAPTPQCAFSATELTVCFENAAGCPGDVVDVDVYVLGPDGCENTLQATGTFALEDFRLANPRMQTDPIGGQCIRRTICRSCSPPSVDWALLRGTAVGVAACPEEYPIGRVDTIRLEIPAGTAAADYPLAVTGGRVFGIEAACGSDTRTILGPTLTVVDP